MRTERITGFVEGMGCSLVCIEVALDPPIFKNGDRRGRLRVALAHAAVAARGKFAARLSVFRIGRITWNRRKPVLLSTLGLKLRFPRHILLGVGSGAAAHASSARE